MSNSQVLIIKDHWSDAMGGKRDIYVYLPASYGKEPERQYPVIYMQAGQRVFPIIRKFSSWNITNTLDRLMQNGDMEEAIVVGIAFAKDTSGSVNYRHEYYIPGDDGKRLLNVDGILPLYERYVVDELIPYIKNTFRVKPGAENTAMIGSSGGATASYHIAMNNSDLIGKLAMLSPFLYYQDGEDWAPFFEEYSTCGLEKVWIDVGDSEGSFTVKQTKAFALNLLTKGLIYDNNLAFHVEPRAGHEENFWGDRVHLPFLYLFGTQSTPCRLSAKSEVTTAVEGYQGDLLPEIHFQNGLRYQAYGIDVHVEQESVLAVNSFAELNGLAEGVSTVTLERNGLQTSCTVTVVNYMAPNVELDIVVNVPESTPEDAPVYLSDILLKRIDATRYGRKVTLPRGWQYLYRFTRSWQHSEATAEGKTVPHRFLAVDQDKQVEMTVERW